MIRTHKAGDLGIADVGHQVTLAGWILSRRDHGGVAFLDLRDASGVVQVVVHDPEIAHGLRDEYCLKIVGDVQARPEGNVNPELASGAIEVMSTQLEVLSTSAPLPFPIDDRVSVGDEIRLRYRYLDLRRPSAGNAIRMRSAANRIARDVLYERGFIEVETPTLTRSTPEGARDFLVPVRLQPGHWYALPQSPQLFKQLLMVGGLERYFQIARCYRDEDFRADRQPEFTQLDIEMSFVEQADVIEVGEAVVRALWRDILSVEIGEIAHITYFEAMRRFGTDKPDLRFGIELVDLTEYFTATPFRVFQAEYVGAVVMPGGADQPRRTFDAWQEWAKQRGAKGLAYVTFGTDGSIGGPVAKNLSDAERDGLREATGAEPGDCVFFAAGGQSVSQALLGAARDEIARRLELADPHAWSFVWVVDAPMFERVENDQGEAGWTAVHHPFTSPNAEWIDQFEQAPDQALAWAYDLVCNGNEIGGGSIRIHQANVQQRVFSLLGLTEEQAREQFGFLLDAFAFGPPPHGGIAFGWDRIAMLLSGSTSLRDVIAFPKTGGGQDPLTAAPAPITAQQRAEAGVDVDPFAVDQDV
ncbi:MAG: aspartate--tRNA ligase [Candidatus Nanopelagicales bacterium]|nr:aspartate--tRNA ligase [Candidatus Nanopelagicales bacterium]MDP4825926.1 aspartate--tRNA ligase [Candidatus Nanopelagicales bacterium]MDP4888786.1 aspartate--tRNA ligase [Candidatus Nanopelagicales bacterium]